MSGERDNGYRKRRRAMSLRAFHHQVKRVAISLTNDAHIVRAYTIYGERTLKKLNHESHELHWSPSQ